MRGGKDAVLRGRERVPARVGSSQVWKSFLLQRWAALLSLCVPVSLAPMEYLSWVWSGEQKLGVNHIKTILLRDAMPEAKGNAGGVGVLWGPGTSGRGLNLVLRACRGGEPAACPPRPWHQGCPGCACPAGFGRCCFR